MGGDERCSYSRRAERVLGRLTVPSPAMKIGRGGFTQWIRTTEGTEVTEDHRQECLCHNGGRCARDGVVSLTGFEPRRARRARRKLSPVGGGGCNRNDEVILMDEKRSSDERVPDPDALIEAFKRDIDRTLLRENLRLTPEQRLNKLQDFVQFLEEVRLAGARHRELSRGRTSSADGD